MDFAEYEYPHPDVPREVPHSMIPKIETGADVEDKTASYLQMTSWLTSVGMAQYIETFIAAEIDMDILPTLTYRDLKELGIEWQQERQALLAKIAETCTESLNIDKALVWKNRKRSPNGRMRDDQLHDDTSDDLNLAPGIQTSPRRPSTGLPDVGKKFKQLSLADMIESDKPRVVKRAPKKTTGKARGALHEWQIVPGTDFVVDRFKSVARVQSQNWFLTHFHSDHYYGLDKSFSRGTIYCSSITAKLVQAKLGVSEEYLQPIPLDQPCTIAGKRVTFVDANHCPGSVMIVFDDLEGPPVLHTGDARLTPETYMNNPAIARLKDKGCTLVLDTTYCDPKYTFPPQQGVIQRVCDTVESELFHPKTLFLFGTYNIGKERIFLEVARRMERQVYVARDKMDALNCMELSPEDQALLTTDHEATNIHAIELWKVKAEGAQRILTRYGNRYQNVIGFRPTGWTYAKAMESTKCGRRTKTGKITIYQVPYSEHSSFTELRDFVHWLDPIRIIPSVGNDEGWKLERMLSWLKQPTLA